MMQPVQHFLYMMDHARAGERGAVYHQHRHAQSARGDELGLRAGAAGVLADDQVDAVLPKQSHITFHRERAAIDHQAVIGQRWRPMRHIDETQQVAMLGQGGKVLHMHPAQGEHDIAPWTRKAGDSARDVRSCLPLVTRFRDPWRARQCQQGRACGLRGCQRVSAHHGREGMRGIYQMRDAMVANVSFQPRDPAKSTNPYGNWLRFRVRDAAGIAKRRGNALLSQSDGQCACFGRTAKDQDVRDV